MSNLTIQELFEAGLHIGHQIKRWNPKSRPYVFGTRHGVSIINLEKTLSKLQEAYVFVEECVGSGKDVWFVGTKQQAQDLMREFASNVKMPYFSSRWLGGALTNFSTVKQSLAKYKRYLKMEQDGSMKELPNKERAVIRREMNRMHRNFEGLVNIDSLGTTEQKLPGALIVVDTVKENIAVMEAKKLKIPVIALVDTNADPTIIDYPIPGNDDSAKAIRLVLEAISEAVQTGLSRREETKVRKEIKPIVGKSSNTHDAEVTFSEDINLETVVANKKASSAVNRKTKKESNKEEE